MKRLLLALLLIPGVTAAGIPVVTPAVADTLAPLDGRTFSSSVMVQMSGDEIAVLDPVDASFGAGHGSIYLFAKQAGGWRQTAKFDPPGGTEGVFRGFALQGDVMVVSIKPSIESLDGARYRAYVLERVNGAWVQTVVLPDKVAGTVRIRDDWMAVPRRRGVEMFQHLGYANWKSAGELPQEGLSYTGDGVVGPAYDFDGVRILIGTDLSQSVPTAGGGNDFYFQVAGRLYELDTGGNWNLTQRLVTNQITTSAFARAEFVSLAEDELSILGLVYRNNGWGYWAQTGDYTSVSPAWLERMRIELLGSGMSWVASEDGSRRDLYIRDGNGFWQPRLRLADGSPTIIASQGSLALGAVITPNAVPRQPGTAVLSLIDIPALAASAHVPAHISNMEIGKTSVEPGESTMVSAWVFAGGSGNAVRNVEYRDSTGAWQPMNAGDGRFDSASEFAQALVSYPSRTYFSPPRVCFRVTDIAGRQTELLDRGDEPCPTLVVRQTIPAIIHVPDDQPPEVETPLLARTLLRYGEDNVIYAFADDSSSGEHYFGQFDFAPTTILAMQLRIDGGVWRAMKPFPRFGETPTVDVGEMMAAYGNLPPATELGHHTACVRAMDSFGNVSVPQCVSYDVTP